MTKLGRKSVNEINFMLFIALYIYMKSSDAKASKCHLKFSSRMIIFYKACIFKFSDFN